MKKFFSFFSALTNEHQIEETKIAFELMPLEIEVLFDQRYEIPCNMILEFWNEEEKRPLLTFMSRPTVIQASSKIGFVFHTGICSTSFLMKKAKNNLLAYHVKISIYAKYTNIDYGINQRDEYGHCIVNWKKVVENNFGSYFSEIFYLKPYKKGVKSISIDMKLMFNSDIFNQDEEFSVAYNGLSPTMSSPKRYPSTLRRSISERSRLTIRKTAQQMEINNNDNLKDLIEKCLPFINKCYELDLDTNPASWKNGLGFSALLETFANKANFYNEILQKDISTRFNIIKNECVSLNIEFDLKFDDFKSKSREELRQKIFKNLKNIHEGVEKRKEQLIKDKNSIKCHKDKKKSKEIKETSRQISNKKMLNPIDIRIIKSDRETDQNNNEDNEGKLIPKISEECEINKPSHLENQELEFFQMRDASVIIIGTVWNKCIVLIRDITIITNNLKSIFTDMEINKAFSNSSNELYEKNALTFLRPVFEILFKEVDNFVTKTLEINMDILDVYIYQEKNNNLLFKKIQEHYRKLTLFFNQLSSLLVSQNLVNRWLISKKIKKTRQKINLLRSYNKQTTYSNKKMMDYIMNLNKLVDDESFYEETVGSHLDFDYLMTRNF